uniref:Uncharacterized protein n=1 Tax=Chenopodium quinoa TaxID=63459 RepID=A0A803LUY5_CHEQI
MHHLVISLCSVSIPRLTIGHYRSLSLMGCGGSSGSRESSLGYLFGSIEALKPASTKAPANVIAESAVKGAAKPATVNP